MSNNRIYVVETATSKHLVEAGNQAQAIRHVAKNQMGVRVASQRDLVELMQAGVEVEAAAADQTQQQLNLNNGEPGND